MLRLRYIEVWNESEILSRSSEIVQELQETIDAFKTIPGGERLTDYVEVILRLCDAHYLSNDALLDRRETQKLLDEAERVVMSKGGEQHFAYPRLSAQKGRFY